MERSLVLGPYADGADGQVGEGACLGQQHVGGRDVPVDDAAAVHVVQGPEDLAHDPLDVVLAEVLPRRLPPPPEPGNLECTTSVAGGEPDLPQEVVTLKVCKC